MTHEPDPTTQAGRILAFLRAHPGATVLEITYAMDPFIANPRARISDLRALGWVIECARRADGFEGFTVREPYDGTLGLTA